MGARHQPGARLVREASLSLIWHYWHATFSRAMGEIREEFRPLHRRILGLICCDCSRTTCDTELHIGSGYRFFLVLGGASFSVTPLQKLSGVLHEYTNQVLHSQVMLGFGPWFGSSLAQSLKAAHSFPAFE